MLQVWHQPADQPNLSYTGIYADFHCVVLSPYFPVTVGVTSFVLQNSVKAITSDYPKRRPKLYLFLLSAHTAQ